MTQPIDFDKKRQEANKEILSVLSELIDENPEFRFGQLLQTLGLHQINFYEEPWITIQVVKALKVAKSHRT